MSRKQIQTPRARGERRPKLGVKKNDLVEVITGSESGKQGRVLRTLPFERRVVVQNVNMRWKHLRKSQDAPQGGRLEREAAIPISNVKLVSRGGAEES